MQLGKGLVRDSSQDFAEDSLEQEPLSAGQSAIGYKRTRGVAGPAHLGALLAARPRILHII